MDIRALSRQGYTYAGETIHPRAPITSSSPTCHGCAALSVRTAGTAQLVTRAQGYALHVDPARFDVRRFAALLSQGRERLEQGDTGGAACSLETALAPFRGPPLDDLAFFPFAVNEVRRLEELRLAAIQERIEALLVSGRNGDLIAELSILVDQHPFVERIHGQLMRALYGAGRQTEALAVYRKLRPRLADELAIEPSASLRELELEMLRQEPVKAVHPNAPQFPQMRPRREHQTRRPGAGSEHRQRDGG